jgi:hypothetical protein
MERIFIAQEAIKQLPKLSHPAPASVGNYQGIPVYTSPHYPFRKDNGDIVWGVMVSGQRLIPLIEEIYQITTA